MGLLLSLTCCSDDDDDRRRQPVAVTLAAYSPSLVEVEPMSRLTRAVEWLPEGYKPYYAIQNNEGLMKSDSGAAIGVYFTQGTTKIARKFRPYISDKWIIDDSVDVGTYQLYGFVPHKAVDTVRSVIAPYNGSYANGVVMTLKGINSVQSQDVCVIVGAKHGTATNQPVSTPRPGDFTCEFKANGNYIFLLFDHLYAAIRFQFRVDATYAGLRTIKMRQMKLSAFEDEACTRPMSKVSTTVTLAANSDGSSVFVDGVEYTTDDNEPSEPVLICDRETNPVTLPSDTWSESLGFVPKVSSYYLLESTYDVYDNNRTTEHPDGNLIRSRCVAVNKIDILRLFNMATLNRGYVYTIKLKIEPTYLYMLSEPDLDNPTVKLGFEN